MSVQNITTEIMVAKNKIGVIRVGEVDYISLTDIAKYKDIDNPAQIISLWMRTYNTIAYLGLWEQFANSDFKLHIFEGFKNESAQPHFWMSPQKWIKETGANGMISKSGRYGGGTFAHPDIAFEFASWISPEFKLYLIKEFERLKQDEAYRHKIVWSAHREIVKTNYLIHTKAIKDNIVPRLTEKQKQFVYANEADLLNVVLFGMTAGQWRKQNPTSPGNIRDYASDAQLKTLINMENTNAQMIKESRNQKERMMKLHELAKEQMGIFSEQKNKRIT